MTFSTKFAAAARRGGLAAVLGASAAATVVGLAGAANAAPTASVPDVNHELGMYGNPAAAAPYWRFQHEGDCALMAIADVVGQITGHEPTEQQIIAQAKKTTRPGLNKPIYPIGPNGGTDNGGMPVLLAHYGIQSAWITTAPSSGTNVLERALAAGHKVIVGVNAGTIHRNGKDPGPDADHAVVVIGIDTKHGVVHLNDSGRDDGHNAGRDDGHNAGRDDGHNAGRDEQVSIAVFEQAWNVSGGMRALVTK